MAGTVHILETRCFEMGGVVGGDFELSLQVVFGEGQALSACGNENRMVV